MTRLDPLDPAPKWRKKPATTTEGRVCAEPGCDTVLSVYNEDELCALHRVTERATRRRRRAT